MQESRRTLLALACLFLLLIYRNTLSHIFLHSCRFFPTCSEYARQSIERFGAVRGIWRAVRRVARCHPLSQGGADPVS